jgi:copper transport protein
VRKHWTALATTVTLLCLLIASPALGHEGNPDFRSEIDSVRPSVPGVSFEVLGYDADMKLVVREGHEVMIYGYEGEPYARVLRDGTVQANQRSPATYLNTDRYAEAQVPKSADPEVAPLWQTVGDSGTLRWHDHRMHYMATGTPPQVKDESKRTKVFDYEIPLRIDGEKGAIDGALFWVGPADTSKTPFLIAGIAIVLLGGAAVLIARRRRGDAVAVLVAVVATLWAPSAAGAHATLESTSPRGATVRQQPSAVVFRFSEPVEGNFGAVRVYDAAGERVDEGDAFHPEGEGERLGVDLKPDLADGSYTATYRVVSADGHIVSGGYVFSIGKAGQAPSATVAELVAAGDSGAATEIGLGIARGAQYAALAAALGALVFLLLAWRPARRLVGDGGERWQRAEGAFERRLRALLLTAATVGAISAVAGIVFGAAQAAGVSASAALDSTILREELGTRFGTVWGLTALAWVIFGLAVVPVLRRPAPLRVAALFAPLAFIALEPALSGHPSTQSPVALLFPANVLHVVAMSVWVGGLASLVLILPAATRELEPPERSRLLATTLARFSPLALACVALILLTGVGQAYAYVRDLDNLLDTAYGRAVLIKLVLLVGALIPLGAYNHYRPHRHRTLRGEVALIVVVLGVTAALAGYPPATAVQSGPFSGSASLGPVQLEVTVDPARVGPNQVHLYLFDARSGAQFAPIEELDVTATLPEKSIGPLPLEPQRSGPGHYTVQGAQLGVAGDWQLEVTVRVSAFDQYASEVEVPIQ